MDKSVVELGVAGLAVWGMYQIVMAVILKKKPLSDGTDALIKIIQENTKAINKLSGLVDKMTVLVQQQADELIRQRADIKDIQVEIARIGGHK